MSAMIQMNLRLFDTQTTLLNAPGNDLSPEMKTYYDKNLLQEASPNLVHDQFGQKRPIPEGSGKTIEFRKFSALPKALKPITEGGTPPGNKLNVSSITATVDPYGDFSEQSDVLELTALDNTIIEATKLLGSQAGRTMDTVVRNEIVGGSNVLYGAKDGTRASYRHVLTKDYIITVDDIFDAAAELKSENTPKIDGSYVAIIHPHVSRVLMIGIKDNGSWMDVNKYANAVNIFEGEIGKLGGVRFVETTEAKIFRGKDLTVASRTLTIKTAPASTATVAVNEAITADDAAALEGRSVLLAGEVYEVVSATVAAAGSATITLDTAVTATQDAVIYPGEGGADGCAVYSTMVLGENAYGVTEVEGGGLQTIVKPLGYGADPLNQRSSVGWKGMKVSKRLSEEYMIRIETGSYRSDDVEDND